MGDVRRIVDAQPDADDQQHRRRRVHGQAPEVHEAHHVDQGEDDAEEDEDGARDVGQHEDDDEEDADEGEDDAPVKLHREDSVNLPELVSGGKVYFSSAADIRKNAFFLCSSVIINSLSVSLKTKGIKFHHSQPILITRWDVFFTFPILQMHVPL